MLLKNVLRGWQPDSCAVHEELTAQHSQVPLPCRLSLLQVKAVKLCNSAKFGLALVIETSPQSGSYVLGFKVDPRETLDYVHKELSSVLQVRVLSSTHTSALSQQR